MPIEPASTALASAIRNLRLSRQMTQEEVAYNAGITPGSFARVEGGRSNPTWTTVKRIATAMDITMSELSAAVEDQSRDAR